MSLNDCESEGRTGYFDSIGELLMIRGRGSTGASDYLEALLVQTCTCRSAVGFEEGEEHFYST